MNNNNNRKEVTCRPKTLDEFVLHKEAKQELVNWITKVIREHKTKSNNNVVVVSGATGVGKSTLVELLCIKFGFVPYVFDTSLAEDTDQLVLRLGALRHMTVDFRRDKFSVIIEGVDTVGAVMSQAIGRLLPAMHVPVFVVCNNAYSPFPRELCRHHAHVRLFPIPDRQLFQLSISMYEATRKALGAHKYDGEIRRSDVNYIVQSSMGDISRCRHLTSFTLGAASAARSKLVAVGSADLHLVNPFEVAKRLFDPNSTLSARERVLEATDDKPLAILFVYHNYLTPTETLESISALTDNLSMSDVFDRFDMPEHFCHLTGAAAAPLSMRDGTKKMDFPKRFFEMERKNKVSAVLEAMRETKAGLRYSRKAGLVMDVHQHLTSAKYVAAVGKDEKNALQYTHIANEFGLDAFRDKQTSLLLLRKIQEQEGVKRASAPTFRPVDDDRHGAAVLAGIVSEVQPAAAAQPQLQQPESQKKRKAMDDAVLLEAPMAKDIKGYKKAKKQTHLTSFFTRGPAQKK